MDRIHLEGIELDLERREVVHADGRRHPLTELEAGLLAHLAARPGALVSKEELLREVWGYAPGVQSRAVDYTVRRLRKKLEPRPRAPVHLVGVYGGKLRLDGVRRSGAGSEEGRLPPRPIDAFVGRAAEAVRLRAALDDGARLVAVLGPGGSGKTRLLLELVPQLELAAARWLSPAEGAEDFAAGVQGVVAVLRQEPGPALVVLDGVDAVLPVVREALPRWLAACPELRIVLSARQRPGIAGEHVVRLAPLAPEEAVRLYEGRAAAAGALHRAGDPEVAELVGMLEGLPLAIELAAERAGVRTVAELRGDLMAPLQALRERGAGGRGLRGVLAASFARLCPEEMAVLERVAAVPGRFARPHAEAAAGPGAVAVLDRLRDHSLVRAHPGARRSFSLELGVRELAWERASAEQQAAAVRALVAWVERRLAGGVPGLLPRAWVRDELLLLRHLHDHSDLLEPAAATGLALAMAPVLAEQGAAAEALDRLGAVPARSMEGVVRGRLLGELGAHDEAVALLEQARTSADPAVRGWACLDLSTLLLMRGQLEPAEACIDEGEAALARVGDRCGLAFALLRRALAHRFRGELEQALAQARASQAVWEDIGDPVGIALCAVDTGLLLRVLGRLQEARRRLKHALAVFEEHGAVRQAARVQTNLGVLCAEQGDRALAEHHYRAALGLYRTVGNRRGEATARINLGAIATQRARFGEAEEHLLDARDIADQLGLDMLSALALGAHGLVRFFEGRRREALRELEASARALHGRAFLHNAAWCATYAGVLRALDGLPEAPGLPAPAAPALVAAAAAIGRGDREAAAATLAGVPPEHVALDDGRALLAWLEERLEAGLPHRS